MYHCTIFLIQLNILFHLRQRCSRRLDTTGIVQGNHITTSVLLTMAFITCVFLRWDGVIRSSRKWTPLSIFKLGSFPQRLLHLWVCSRYLLAVLPWFTHSNWAATVGRLEHCLIAYVDAIETAAVCRVRICDPLSCSPQYWWGSSLCLLPCKHTFDIKVS